MLAKLKERLSGAIKKYSGRKDILEALCAGVALVASSDGEVSDDEIKAIQKVVSSNPLVSASFRQGEIDKCVDTMLKRASTGRSGRIGLYREIEEIRADSVACEDVFLCAYDIADADGKMDPKEKSTLMEIASKLGVNPAIANG